MRRARLGFRTTPKGVTVSCGWWEVTHLRSAGGAWSSIVFKRGSGRNLLARPASSMLRFCEPDPRGGQGARYFVFREANERRPSLAARREGDEVVVTAGGRYRDARGRAIGVAWQRTTRYNAWGLASIRLEITADEPCPGVVELCALDMVLRPGTSRAHVRHHPMMQDGMAGGAGWLDLSRQSFACRWMPSYVAVYEDDVEGLELYAPSRLTAWDALSGHEGQGLYEVRPDESGGTYVAYNPYCMAFRRVPMTLTGRYALDMYAGLPFVEPRGKVFNSIFHAGAGSRWASDRDLERLAAAGVKLVRFHNDYREDGPFWHDGTYPPFDPKGMRELRRVIDTSHRLGMKAVPYVSLKEFHPESPGFADNFRRWQRMETASGELTHTWTGSGEYGALMCMKSGWLDFRKRACDVMLSDLPWDGLYFDWCTFHHCRNRLHDPGEWHTDVEEFLDFVLWARRRVGPRGFLFVHLSGVPSFVCENAADLVTIGELDGVFGPDSWSPEYRMVPVAQKMSAMWSVSGRQRTLLVYSGMLQGHPSALATPVTAAQEELLAQIALFRGEELSAYSFARSSDRPVATGRDGVWACLWWRRSGALVYAANLTDAAASGRLTVDLAGRGVRARSFRWERIEPPQAAPKAGRGRASPQERLHGEGHIGSAELAASGLEYDLRPWSAALYALRAAR